MELVESKKVPTPLRAKWQDAVVRRRIANCLLKDSTALDLSSMGIANVAPELLQCSSLTQLDLSSNQLTAAPLQVRPFLTRRAYSTSKT